jgi:hypothetical protein
MFPITYHKRHRMERLLTDPLRVPAVPIGYALLPWHPDLLDAHAQVKFASFQGTVDTIVFPSLSDLAGCRALMEAISRRPTFHAAATWLLQGPTGPCGTVQGVRAPGGFGAIQNLGIIPCARGHGLGELLLLQAMQGFKAWGLQRVMLEVTAENAGAVRLYRRLGFRSTRTVYKAVERIPADVFR